MRISDWSSDVCSSDLPDRAARADGIEPVLRTQLRRDVARAERHADDAPVAVARGHRIVGVDRLMRAVEGANADMDDARCLRRAVIARPLHRSEEHTSELQSLMRISYAGFRVKKTK